MKNVMKEPGLTTTLVRIIATNNDNKMICLSTHILQLIFHGL